MRDRYRVWAGEGQRKRGTQNLKQAPGSELPAQNSNPQTVRSWPELKLKASLTEPPSRPHFGYFLSKKIEYLAIKLSREVWTLYTGNYKTFLKKIKDDLSKWKDVLCASTRRFMVTYPKIISRFNAIPIKNPGCHFAEIDKMILKSHGNARDSEQPILKKNILGRLTLEFKTYSKVQ